MVTRVMRRKTNCRHMTGDHHGQGVGRATLLVRAMDAILGTHRWTLTPIWQLPTLPSVPEYCRATQGDAVPSLANPVSSTTSASQLGTRGIYGDHGPFNVVVNPGTGGTNDIVISAFSQSQVHVAEAIAALGRRGRDEGQGLQ
jgi:hypothetical protein